MSWVRKAGKEVLNQLDKFQLVRDAVAYFLFNQREGNQLHDVFNERSSKTGQGEDKYLKMSELMLDYATYFSGDDTSRVKEMAAELESVLKEVVGDDPNYSHNTQLELTTAHRGVSRMPKMRQERINAGIGSNKSPLTVRAAKEFSAEDAGAWSKAERGLSMGLDIQEAAKKFGWDGAMITDLQSEDYFSAAYDAENFLQSLAPAGHRFGITENGDWGMWMMVDESVADEPIADNAQAAPVVASRFASTFGALHGRKSLKARMHVKAQEFTPEDAGVWSTSDRGEFIGLDIQKAAQKYGWDGAMVEDVKSEEYYNASYDAENFLQAMAPAGYRFSVSEDGDWGLWKSESPEEAYLPQYEEGDVYASRKTIGLLGSFAKVYGRMIFTAKPDRDPTPEEMSNAVREGGTLVWDDSARTYYISRSGRVIADGVLARTTIASEFREELWPEQDSHIKEGSRVYVKALKALGEVIEPEGDAFHVKASLPDPVNPGQRRTVTGKYWGTELELR